VAAALAVLAALSTIGGVAWLSHKRIVEASAAASAGPSAPRSAAPAP
jgi:hypothetical protein